MAQGSAAAGSKDRGAVLSLRVSANLTNRIRVEAAGRGLIVAQPFKEMSQPYLEQQHACE